MANQSDKKLQKQKETTAPIYFAVVTAFTLLYGLFLLYSMFGSGPIKLKLFLFLLYTGINMFCYQNVVKGLELGVNYSTYVDILAINNVFLVVSLFTYKVFYLLYAGPVYLGYLILKWVWGFMNTEYKKDDEVESKKDKKKKEKVKYKTIK